MSPNIFTPRFKNAKVFFRIFPTVKMHWDYVKILEDMKTLYVRYLQDVGLDGKQPEPSYWKFDTDGIFYNNTQDEIYEAVMPGVLEKVVEGHSAVILAYGQTGSGKSLTISGLHNSFKDKGISPRVISDLFKKKESLKNRYKMCIQMSYIETKKMYVTDLLNPDAEDFTAFGLKNIKQLKVKDEYNAMKVLFKAEGRREFSEDFSIKHAANGVLTFHITLKPLNQTDSIRLASKIHIVDLAGGDTYGNLPSLHKNIFQVGNANLAKTQLEQFVMILCQNIPEQIFVKQNLNVLIKYLGDSLTTHSVLRVIGHLRTDKENLVITLSMLRFGQIIRGLKPQKLKANVSEVEEIKVQMLQEELKELKKENDLNVMLTNSDLSSNITQERIKHMQNVAQEYIQDKTNELVVVNVTDTYTVLKVFKDLYNKLEAEKIECTKLAYEKAYEDALINIKKGPMKSDSSQSMKGSRKASRKSGSRDGSSSIDNNAFPKSTKKTSKLSMSRTGSPQKLTGTGSRGKSTQSLSKYKISDQQSSKVLKRMRTNSSNLMKRSATSRRRSSSSTATGNTGVNGSLLDEIPLPETIPAHEEAWNSFRNDTDYNYNDLIEVLNTNEETAKGAHRDYLIEVKHLQKLIEAIDTRKSEYQKAQMQRVLRKQEYDEEGNIIMSDLEKLCLDNLRKAHEELLEQQEKVLKAQSEFSIALETCHHSKKNINDQFEVFCREKLQTYVPNLETSSLEIVEQNVKVADTLEEGSKTTLNSLKCSDVAQYESLKQLMKKQIEKKINKREKSKKWIQSCKT